MLSLSHSIICKKAKNDYNNKIIIHGVYIVCIFIKSVTYKFQKIYHIFSGLRIDRDCIMKILR